MLLPLVCLAAVVFFRSAGRTVFSAGAQEAAGAALPPRGCTIFTVAREGRVFFGGNSDWINFDSDYYWVDPGDATRYGVIYFGVPDNVQQGFNEKGLAYDANGLPPVDLNPHPERRSFYGIYIEYVLEILRSCATVQEVIDWVNERQWHTTMHDQLHFADANGDAVVISAGPDGEVAFTRKPAGDGFLVSTNYNLANPANGSYPCWRHARATELLQEIDSPYQLTAARAAAVLDAVHVAKPDSWTVASVVGDLPRGLVYVYLFHQFDAPIVLDISKEIARNRPPGPLSDLFPAETVTRAEQVRQQLELQPVRCRWWGIGWLGLVAASLVVLFAWLRPKRREALLWVPVVAVLGPVGLLLHWLAGRRPAAGALLEAAPVLPSVVAGLVLALLLLLSVPALGQSSVYQLLLQVGVPLVAALFVYPLPVVAYAGRRNYLRTLLGRLPTTIVSTNLVLAGALAIGIPLIGQQLEVCGLDSCARLLWWPIFVPGAFLGGLLLSVYQRWAIKRGYAFWSLLLRDPAEPTLATPGWRRLWLWLVASFFILLAGIAVGAIATTLVAGG